MTANEFHQKYGVGANPPPHVQASQSQPQGGNQMSWLPQMTGAAGGILGGIGGAFIPGAGETGLGEVGGAMVGSSAGQGLGEWLRQALTGQKTNVGNIANQAGQGALWGALPGGKITEGIANPLLRMGAKAAIRGVGGAAVGGATQAMQNVQQGKPVGQNVPQTATETGGINAILPGVGAVGKEVVQSHLGSSADIFKNLMAKFLITGGKAGADYTDNPAVTDIVTKNMSSPKKAAQALGDAATQLYKTQLQPAFEKTAVTLKDFVSAITAQGGYMFSPKEERVLNNALIKAANVSTGAAKDAITLAQQMSQKTGLLGAVSGKLGQVPISLDAINTFKQNIPWTEDTQDLYRTVRQFIEDKMANTPVGELNKTYHALQDAGQKLEQKRLDANGNIQLKPNMNWGGRIKAGIMGSVLSGAAQMAAGTSPTGLSPFSGLGGLTSILTKMVADEAQQKPETAVPYAKALQLLEKGGGGLMRLLQSAAPRLPGMMNAQPTQ